jgi:hypothetical protein
VNRVTRELGGKSADIILHNANLENAVEEGADKLLLHRHEVHIERHAFATPASPVMRLFACSFRGPRWLKQLRQRSSLQYALWDLMTPGAEPMNFANADGTTVALWLALAAANYGQINPANFVIATNTGTLAYTGQVQEFIVQTPEPATGVLLLFGVVALSLLFRRSQQQLA